MLYQKQIEINRPLRKNDIATIVSVANGFESEVHLRKANHQVNLKSSLGVFALRLTKNDDVTLIAYGPDSKRAVEAIERFFVSETSLKQ